MSRNREQIMSEWDVARKDIASGCTNSRPRDWFEGVLDEWREDRIAELEDALRRAREQIIDQQATPDPPTWIDDILSKTQKG